jgi:hypothetical protein
VVVPLV